MRERLPPLRDRLRKAAQALGVPIDVVEFDYGLSYALAAIYARDDLRESFVFKGGTALEKAYFAGYRFSRDLDFTAVGGPRGDELKRTMEAVSFLRSSSARQSASGRPALPILSGLCRPSMM